MEFPEEGLWLIGNISRRLISRNMFMCVAESCTGGLVSVLCTNVPGSSKWFCGGLVTYADYLKTRLLNVDKGLIEEHGSVSEAVVEAMAAGVLQATGATVGLAISGIAGPEGGTAEKPVGTVWISTIAYMSQAFGSPAKGPVISSFRRNFTGYRDDIRMSAALAGLEALHDRLK
ncbi:MAG: CinA family protein [Desulfovibrio sp.]|nr:CinA family protein [Desulfovibrio sp.]